MISIYRVSGLCWTRVAVRDWKWGLLNMWDPPRTNQIADITHAVKPYWSFYLTPWQTLQFHAVFVAVYSYLAQKTLIYLKTLATEKDFFQSTISTLLLDPRCFHSKTVCLHTGIKCTLRSIFTMAFHIHPKWLFYHLKWDSGKHNSGIHEQVKRIQTFR